MSKFSFEGQVAWVTGSSTGIGRATTLAFAQRGADVVVHCHVPENVGQVQELVTCNSRMMVLGTRHSFNGIADSTEILLSLQKLNRVTALDHTLVLVV